MAVVTWTEPALHDLDTIRRFLARDSRPVADMLIERIFRSTDRLRDFPRSGRTVPESRGEDVREIIVQNYRVIPDEVEILAVLHGARNLRPGDLAGGS